MAILDKLTWIDGSALTRFILSAQVRRHTQYLLSCLYCVWLASFVLGLIDPTFRTQKAGESPTGQATWWTYFTHCSA